MRSFGLVIFGVGLLIGLDEPKKADSGKDQKALQGAWTMVSALVNGDEVPEDQVKTARLVVTGNRYTPKFGEMVVNETFSLDPNTTPKSIDFTYIDGPRKGEIVKGIYKLEGDRYIMCRTIRSEDERPKEFASGAESGLVLVVWQRSKEPPDIKEAHILKERERLAGTWKAVSYTRDGREAPADELENVVLVFAPGGTATVTNKGETIVEGTTEIDPAVTPRSIDLTFTDGPNKGLTSRGIYETDGETFRLCRASPGAPRPKAFASEPGSGLALMVYRRDKTSAAAAKAELTRFEGTWRYVSVLIEGKPTSEETLKDEKLVLTGDRFAVISPGETHRGTYSVDPSATPHTLDVSFTEGPQAGTTRKGIYELEGDTCRVCMGLKGRPRPTAFASEPGNGQVLEVLRREKP
jgi:uncharacterized protein (TIGR03067 family)